MGSALVWALTPCWVVGPRGRKAYTIRPRGVLFAVDAMVISVWCKSIHPSGQRMLSTQIASANDTSLIELIVMLRVPGDQHSA